MVARPPTANRLPTAGNSLSRSAPRAVGGTATGRGIERGIATRAGPGTGQGRAVQAKGRGHGTESGLETGNKTSVGGGLAM
eukprot:scaffold655706_cov32-Prasinocladus_malaysianus.AAC.1